MNSLENLNNWANDSIAYGGDATYSITFDAASATNQSTSVIEDQAFVSPPGINITSLVSTPRPIKFTVDLSSVALPATIDWGTLPYYISSQVDGTNIFSLVGPMVPDAWTALSHPNITIIDQNTTFTYTNTITYPDPGNTANDLTKSWTTTVTVTAVPNISTPSAFVYTKNSIGTISGTPTITNSASGTYQIIITPSLTTTVLSLSSSGTGGTSTYNAVTKTLTLVGTKTQVNSHLASIQFQPVTNTNQNFDLEYRLINPSGLQNTVTQSLTSGDPFVINALTYLEDTPVTLGYQILDTSATATNFTISIAQTTPLPSVSAGYFTVNGSNVGNTWTTSNTKANINAANVVYQPPVDYTGTLTFTVNQSKIDNGNTVNQVINEPINIYNAGGNPEITNMVSRNFLASRTGYPFSNSIPQINDGPDVGQSYTITFYTSLGRFGSNVANALAQSTFSFTGNLTACNNLFANIAFVPNWGIATSGTYTYTQSRNGTLQVNTTQPLNYQGNSSVSGFLTSFTSNSTVTLSQDQILYGNIQILTVGGGGAGQNGQSSPRAAGGGGGGGGVYNVLANRNTANALSAGTYNVVVGGGATTRGSNGGNSYISLGGTVKFLAQGGTGGDSSGGGGSSWFNGQNTGGSSGAVNAHNDAGGGGGGSPVQAGSSAGGSSVMHGGNGANGYISNISGANVYYGAGGGGGVYDATGSPDPVPGLGGTGGGGNGSGVAGGGSAKPGTGIGAGGGGMGGGVTGAGAGAAGIVIIKVV